MTARVGLILQKNGRSQSAPAVAQIEKYVEQYNLMAIPLTHAQERYAALKTRVHQKLLSVLNMDAVKAESRQELRREVQSVLEKILREDRLPISMTERNRLAEEILDEVFGLGPLEPLLKDATISDILVNTHK